MTREVVLTDCCLNVAQEQHDFTVKHILLGFRRIMTPEQALRLLEQVSASSIIPGQEANDDSRRAGDHARGAATWPHRVSPHGSQPLRGRLSLSLSARCHCFAYSPEIWSVPEVGKVGVDADESGLQVGVFMTHDQRDARARIYDAERDYLNATRPHGFSLRVTLIARSGAVMIAPFETVLER